ncbi:G-type lectin S-receptor-like serine/threonine-protein kinase LECRK3 [Ziziphus jujuba]|uniref:Receptor-like serine/threonine-protein kinase n=1 Tax=Ziziphus jujuba TaxID=326968 RepID=A0A6P3ZL75_ZIZJJ|nr:G-type lectin S-receptor-like serine/threonine-protein kinase LECRK3 [Ziziphus jujuba]
MAFVPIYPLLFFFFFLVLTSSQMPFYANAQTYKNVSLGSSLIAQNNINSFWASPSAEFAFGFQQIQKDGFLLAIWFNKIPEKTIVWSANGNDLVPTGSKFELTIDGQLLLKTPTGQQIWKADSSNATGVAYAAMLDTGNFVLANNGSINLWETFKQPTDTILPTQPFVEGDTIFSRYNETKYSEGKFLISFRGGDLVLFTRHSASDVDKFYVWDTAAANGTELIFNISGSIYLAAKDGSIASMLSPNNISTKDFYQRAVIDYDGAFRHYVYPKSSTSSEGRPLGWSILSAVPSNICLLGREDRGVGPCGFNSYCTYDQRATCHCPGGYSFIDPDDVAKGCKQDFVSQSCNKESPETDLFHYSKMPNGDWGYSDYEHFENVTEDYCWQSCLEDCICVAVMFRQGGVCFKKKPPLSNGRMDPSIDGTILVKVRKDNSTISPRNSVSKKNNSSTLILVGSILLSSSVFVNCLLLLVTFLVGRSYNKIRKEIQEQSIFPGMGLQSYTYEDIKKVTNDFSEEIGSGAFGTVFKGVLTSDHGKLVAVKRFNSMVAESDVEFKTEVSAIDRTNHRNLVKLLGFCNEEQHRLLVYEFMSNGSLESFLFGVSRINWYSRIQIASEAAKGLLYLHDGCSTQIIHCDIKPQNILLDDKFTAKISDFGLAKLLKTDQTRTTTGIRGTKGYVAPEWFSNQPITVKVDVYSFGILLLELICGRRNVEAEAGDENEIILADWAYECYTERKLELLVKDDKEAMEDLKRVEKLVKIAIWCIQDDPSLRPTMKNVKQMMEGIVEVPIPPDPSSA